MTCKALLCSVILAALVACGGGGGGSSSSTNTDAHTFTMKLAATGTKANAALRPMAAIAPMDAVDAAQAQLLIGIAANQGGTLVTGYSGTPLTTDTYNVTTALTDGLNNGLTLGYGGISQTFAATDPSFLPAGGGVQAPTGSGTVPASTGSLGLFMATFASTGTTTLNMVANTSSLPQVDEVVLRTANSVLLLTWRVRGGAAALTQGHRPGGDGRPRRDRRDPLLAALCKRERRAAGKHDR